MIYHGNGNKIQQTSTTTQDETGADCERKSIRVDREDGAKYVAETVIPHTGLAIGGDPAIGSHSIHFCLGRSFVICGLRISRICRVEFCGYGCLFRALLGRFARTGKTRLRCFTKVGVSFSGSRKGLVALRIRGGSHFENVEGRKGL